ncbi:MAG TPA: alkaline phosphatase family protein, partial [Sphingomicrobium sp.]|nr:alkaline phosphatase family protein [Sphingomicrobium sp.]
DQFSADLFDEYRGEFTGGLARLSREGIVFRNGYQSHAATETCPGHSTILTGDHPARTGIISNDWYLPASARGRTAIYCAEDESKGTRDAYVVSAVHLRVATLGDRLKPANPRSQSVAVAGKDRAAVMMGGHRPDVRWYYRDGRFQTDLPGQPSTPEEIAVNRDVAAQIAAGVPPLPIPVSCAARDRATELPGGRTVGTGRLANGPGASDYPYGPALDRETLALASGLVDERQLGRDGAPDVLAISLSATDYVGHRYGTEGLEMCLQLHALDQALGQFFAGLDRRGLDYVVVLTADHGGTDIPERLRSSDPNAQRTTAALSPRRIGGRIARALRLPTNPLIGGGSDVYLAAGLDPATRVRVLEMAAAAYRADPQVAAVFTKAQLQALPVPSGNPVAWTLEQRARASFDWERSGDLIVLLKRHVVAVAKPSAHTATTHGSAWDNDRRVPIVFWRRGMAARTVETPADTVDIMPTLAAIIGLPVASGSVDGICLRAVAGAACPAR